MKIRKGEKGRGREIFADIFFFFFFFFERRVTGDFLPVGWEHPGQRWMGVVQETRILFLAPPANGTHLSDRVDLRGSGARESRIFDASSSSSSSPRPLNFEKNSQVSLSLPLKLCRKMNFPINLINQID